MLIQVKGRRYCQPRLMEPTAKSINSGDAFVLVTPTDVFNWVGRFSNVIERNRSAEIAASILQRKELGCTRARYIIDILYRMTRVVSSTQDVNHNCPKGIESFTLLIKVPK